MKYGVIREASVTAYHGGCLGVGGGGGGGSGGVKNKKTEVTLIINKFC